MRHLFTLLLLLLVGGLCAQTQGPIDPPALILGEPRGETPWFGTVVAPQEHGSIQLTPVADGGAFETLDAIGASMSPAAALPSVRVSSYAPEGAPLPMHVVPPHTVIAHSIPISKPFERRCSRIAAVSLPSTPLHLGA